jgi:integrase
MKARSGYIIEKNGKIYARICYTDSAGKRRELKRLAADRTEAKKLLKELQAKLDSADRDQRLEAERMTFAQLAERYEERKLIPAEYQGERKIAGLRSLASPKLWLARLVEHFGNRLIHSITHSEVEAYKLRRLRGCLAIASVNRELAVLRAALNFGKREGWLVKTPFELGAPLISKADETKRNRVLTRDEETRLLAACTGRRAHLRALVIAATDTGCRRGELLTLKWTDVNLPGRIISIRAFNTKTATARIVPISERLFAELTRLHSAVSGAPDGLVFGITDNMKRSFTSACKEAGIEGLRFHDLRHTAATRLASAGLPLSELAGLLGHTQIQTTLRYANTTGEAISRAASILNSLNGSKPSSDEREGELSRGLPDASS